MKINLFTLKNIYINASDRNHSYAVYNGNKTVAKAHQKQHLNRRPSPACHHRRWYSGVRGAHTHPKRPLQAEQLRLLREQQQ